MKEIPEDMSSQPPWAGLTPEQKAEALKIFKSENEYDAIRRVDRALSDDVPSDLVPARDILTSLRAAQKTRYAPRFVPAFFAYKVPAFAAVVVVVAATAGAWLMGRSMTPRIAPLEPRLIVKVDTVRVTDTVYHERVVYRTRTEVRTAAAPPSAAIAETPSASIGVSMSEKAELEKLLVSGLE